MLFILLFYLGVEIIFRQLVPALAELRVVDGRDRITATNQILLEPPQRLCKVVVHPLDVLLADEPLTNIIRNSR